jgi:hypothetical protein
MRIWTRTEEEQTGIIIPDGEIISSSDNDKTRQEFTDSFNDLDRMQIRWSISNSKGVSCIPNQSLCYREEAILSCDVLGIYFQRLTIFKVSSGIFFLHQEFAGNLQQTLHDFEFNKM